MEPEQRKQQIMESAIEVFAAKGFHGASVADILKRAEIARGTFYLYFQSKKQIFSDILESAIETLNTLMVRIDLASPVSPAEQLRLNVRRVVDYLFEQPLLARILFVKSDSADPELEQKLEEFYTRVAELLMSSLKLGQEIGLLRTFDIQITSYAIIGAIRELGCQFAGKMELEEERERMVEQLLKLFLSGLARTPESFGL